MLFIVLDVCIIHFISTVYCIYLVHFTYFILCIYCITIHYRTQGVNSLRTAIESLKTFQSPHCHTVNIELYQKHNTNAHTYTFHSYYLNILSWCASIYSHRTCFKHCTLYPLSDILTYFLVG